MQRLVRGVAPENGGASVEFEPSLLVNPLEPSAAQDELVQALCMEAPSIVGHELDVHGVPIFTDARWFSGVGVPVVLYGAGPRDPAEAKGHAADENVRIE